MYQEQNYTLMPHYEDSYCKRIGVLQQLQILLGHDATLSDVALLVQDIEHEFGVQEQLERVIQALVGRTLSRQLTNRKHH